MPEADLKRPRLLPHLPFLLPLLVILLLLLLLLFLLLFLLHCMNTVSNPQTSEPESGINKALQPGERIIGVPLLACSCGSARNRVR